MMKLLFSATIAGCLAFSSVAEARSTYDGSWDLVFVTQRGACDPTYNFSVNMTAAPRSSSLLVIWAKRCRLRFPVWITGSGANGLRRMDLIRKSRRNICRAISM
jgi:hypothetical protein